VGWNVGNFRQGAAETEALAARVVDLLSGVAELRARVGRFLFALTESAARLREELLLLDRQLALYRERLSTERVESERLRQSLALLEMDYLELSARRVFVERLLGTRAAAGSALQ
jgi:hypothetical protein